MSISTLRKSHYPFSAAQSKKPISKWVFVCLFTCFVMKGTFPLSSRPPPGF